MLKLTGKTGKSLVVEAIQNRFNNLRIYSYNEYVVPTMESYHVDSSDCSVGEFCQFIYEHISKCEKDDSPIDIVVIYTNLSDTEEIEKLANRLECEQFVRMTVVTGK